MEVNRLTGEITQPWSSQEEVDTATLAATHHSLQETIDILRRRQWEIGIELNTRLEAIDATVWSGDSNGNRYVVKVEPKLSYDTTRLTPLLEYSEIPQAELDAARTPDKVIPAGCDMRKVKPLAKYSGRIRDLIELATITEDSRLRVINEGASS